MTSERHNILVGLVGIVAIMVIGSLPDGARADGSPGKNDKKLADAAEQSARAARAFDAIMQAPDKAIPRELLSRAKAVAVFPRVVKVALTFGGEGGRGVVSRHTGDDWSSPVFLRGGGASWGAQIGASSTDYFFLLMNDESVEGLMKDKFELGGEASVAAGPVGRNAGGGTDALMHAAVLSYSRTRGVFAGANLKGVVVRPEDDLNTAVYSHTARELLSASGPEESASEALQTFPDALRRYAHQ